ncbi:MAG TPA: glycine cleavage system aminomethyltransferase GcvT, partial [Steroidobacteraceae bacterium]|nr:glycine cleavage system aminomethyltransferase GcvT [Steroidobacteraceae bacterium]
MGLKTPLHARHVALGARMVDFGGWDMPVNYGSQIEEHHAVRRDAGLFAVSHMLAVDLEGSGVREFLRRALANDVAKLKVPGKALYSCMLNEEGGVVDDLITYFFREDWFRLVVNAGTSDKDLAWLERLKAATGATLTITPRRDLAIVAIQGPKARERLWQAYPNTRAATEPLGPFSAALVGTWMVARTGYTGEDGFEVILPAGEAVPMWEKLAAGGARPAGLGARDTLRLEAGMALYGQDMDESVSPLEAGLAWTVAFDEGRDFIGRAALERQIAAGVPRQTVGLVLDDKGVLRHGQAVQTAGGAGEILS